MNRNPFAALPANADETLKQNERFGFMNPGGRMNNPLPANPNAMSNDSGWYNMVRKYTLGLVPDPSRFLQSALGVPLGMLGIKPPQLFPYS
jgi:hypothetical protein